MEKQYDKATGKITLVFDSAEELHDLANDWDFDGLTEIEGNES